jgi:predicted short-subunit dehydrogenase-like oxidoreductase (DUF2520 family)
MKASIGFIGCGVTGTAIACLLHRQAYPVVAAYSRSLASTARLSSFCEGSTICTDPQQVGDLASVVFITTPDDVISDIASVIAWHPGQVVIHCSGVHSTDILAHAGQCEAHSACLHPLQTFAGIDEAISTIAGSTIAIEGEGKGLAVARELAVALDGNVILLNSGDKVLYHAAAVTLSNYLVALIKMAAEFWQSLGVSQENAVRAMLPLLKGTVNNIERVGVPGCLTGPIARGDIETIKKHLAALEKSHPESLELYRLLGLKTLPIASSKGRLSAETGDEIRRLLDGKEIITQSNTDDFYRGIWLETDAGSHVSIIDKSR